jgi:pimeloyl-ACP methyl ester carboxylesterase
LTFAQGGAAPAGVVAFTRKAGEGPFVLQNQSGKRLVGRVRIVGKKSHFVLLVHGFGGNQNQEQIVSASEVFVRLGCNVVTFDATDSIGVSDGRLANFRLNSMKDDIVDVIRYCRDEVGFTGKCVICGFSMGASASILALEADSIRISGIIGFGPMISGSHWLNALEKNRPGSYAILERTGRFLKFNKAGEPVGEITSEFIEDIISFDLNKLPQNSNVQIHLVGFGRDITCPHEIIERFCATHRKNFRYHFIPDNPHTAHNGEEHARIEELIVRLIGKRESFFSEQKINSIQKSGMRRR